MTISRQTILIIASLAIGAVVLTLAWSPITRVALARSKGIIDQGSFLGVQIGQSPLMADLRMDQMGLRLIEQSHGMNCMGIHYSPRYEVRLYYDSSWRSGTVCVASVDGRIASIRWYYDFLSP